MVGTTIITKRKKNLYFSATHTSERREDRLLIVTHTQLTVNQSNDGEARRLIRSTTIFVKKDSREIRSKFSPSNYKISPSSTYFYLTSLRHMLVAPL